MKLSRCANIAGVSDMPIIPLEYPGRALLGLYLRRVQAALPNQELQDGQDDVAMAYQHAAGRYPANHRQDGRKIGSLA